MKIKTVVVGELETNCYIVENEDSCLVIDPGEEFLKIKDKEIESCYKFIDKQGELINNLLGGGTDGE